MFTSTNQAPADIAIIEPPPEIRSSVKKTALLVSWKVAEIERKIMAISKDTEDFNFLRKSDPYHAFYQNMLAEYRALNQYIDGPDPLANLKGDAQPRPPATLPEGFSTQKELSTVDLTAKYVARYGVDFWLHLYRKEHMNPQFEFLTPADSKFEYFDQVAVSSSEFIKRSEKLTSARMEIVIEGFFYYLHRLEELRIQKEGMEKAPDKIKLSASVGGGDGRFAHIKDEDLPLLKHPMTWKNFLSETERQPAMLPLGSQLALLQVQQEQQEKS
ncbi:PREDICTED: probable splicing factor 3A subunit 1 [Camelina sativa]|uniref:Probable splicing factor 3A subunit 1 n=1 Tax=Camelina sativa TaxID=90675 RepID=A0ABM0Y461_CAMSA|nr:PREDICTED: probable splicing factor 3A subunit 1 [Camelina sativa]